MCFHGATYVKPVFDSHIEWNDSCRCYKEIISHYFEEHYTMRRNKTFPAYKVTKGYYPELPGEEYYSFGEDPAYTYVLDCSTDTSALFHPTMMLCNDFNGMGWKIR